jgi:hypothetical protein
MALPHTILYDYSMHKLQLTVHNLGRVSKQLLLF